MGKWNNTENGVYGVETSSNIQIEMAQDKTSQAQRAPKTNEKYENDWARM